MWVWESPLHSQVRRSDLFNRWSTAGRKNHPLSTGLRQIESWLGFNGLAYGTFEGEERGRCKKEWNAAPESIVANAGWFFPYLERFLWGVRSLAENYVIEGVDFLPAQVARLSAHYQIRSVFLGCSRMTLEAFDQFPGHSEGYRHLPEAMRRQIVEDVPRWSEFIRQEAGRFGYPYFDTSDDFAKCLKEAEALLTTG